MLIFTRVFDGGYQFLFHLTTRRKVSGKYHTLIKFSWKVFHTKDINYSKGQLITDVKV